MARPIAREEITENLIAIRVSRSCRENMTPQELYEATRGYWRVSLRQAERAEYALSVWGGVVRAVYKIEKWLPAGTVPRPTLPDAETPPGRYEFVGRSAEGDILDKYMGRSVAGLFQRGEANPIKYFFPTENVSH